MSTRHLPLPHYLTCLSLLIRIKLQQLFFGRWGFKSRSRCQTAGGRLHDSDCRDPVGSLTNKCAVMSTAAMSVDVKSKESSVSADRILKANADLQQLMPSGSFKIFDCTLRLQAATRNWSVARRWSCSNDSAMDFNIQHISLMRAMWVSVGIRGASNSCKLTSPWMTSWSDRSDMARIDTQSAKLQPESTEKSAVEHSNQVTIIEKGWNGEHLLYWSRNGEWSESTCPWVGGMCVWWGWGVKTGRGEKLTRKENWWLCLTHVTAWDLILNMVVQTKPWKSSVTCVLLSHLTPATKQKYHRQSHHDHAPVPFRKVHLPC